MCKKENNEVSRIEFINHSSNGEQGRITMSRGSKIIVGDLEYEVQFQDNNRTLKIFISDYNKRTKNYP